MKKTRMSRGIKFYDDLLSQNSALNWSRFETRQLRFIRTNFLTEVQNVNAIFYESMKFRSNKSNNFLLQLKGNKIETTKRRTLLDKNERVFGAF